MDSFSEPRWVLFSGRSQYRSFTEEELFSHPNFSKTVMVVDSTNEDFYKGMCFVYGTRPKAFHVIPNGHAIRFEPTSEHQMFAYPYHPVYLQLDYTSYVDVSVAADAKP